MSTSVAVVASNEAPKYLYKDIVIEEGRVASVSPLPLQSFLNGIRILPSSGFKSYGNVLNAVAPNTTTSSTTSISSSDVVSITGS